MTWGFYCLLCSSVGGNILQEVPLSRYNLNDGRYCLGLEIPDHCVASAMGTETSGVSPTLDIVLLLVLSQSLPSGRCCLFAH